MRRVLAGSPIVASHRGPDDVRVQDAYSVRCAPQVAGAARDTLAHARAVAAQQRWRERLERHRLAAGQQLEEAEGEVTLSRGALVEAHQRRATLDRLKDTKAAQHRADADRRDAAEADEIALRQHHGRKRHRSTS